MSQFVFSGSFALIALVFLMDCDIRIQGDILQSYGIKHSVKPFAHGVSNKLLLVTLGIITALLLTGVVAELFGELVAKATFAVILFIAVAFSDYRTGALIAIVLLPFSATHLMPREMFGVLGLNPFNVTLLMSVLSMFYLYVFHRRRVVIPSYSRFFWFYLCVMGFATIQGSLHVSEIPAFYRLIPLLNFDSMIGYVRDIFIKPLFIILTAFILSVAIRNSRRPSIFLIPLFCSAIALPIVAIIYIKASGASLSVLASATSRDVLSVIGMHANEMGLMFNMAFALALFTHFSTSSAIGKWLLKLAMVILTVAVFLTFSRGAYLGFVAVIVYFLFTHRKFRIILASLFLIPMAILFMPQAMIERATTGTQSGNVADMSAGRVDSIWLPLAPEILSSPVIGHGMSSILWSDAARKGRILQVGHPHSAYLGALLDFGVLGSFVILFFFAHMWRLFSNLAQHPPEPIWRGFFRGAIACILLLMVQGMTDDRFTPTVPQTFLWLSYGIAMGLSAKSRELSSNHLGKVRMV